MSPLVFTKDPLSFSPASIPSIAIRKLLWTKVKPNFRFIFRLDAFSLRYVFVTSAFPLQMIFLFVRIRTYTFTSRMMPTDCGEPMNVIAKRIARMMCLSVCLKCVGVYTFRCTGYTYASFWRAMTANGEPTQRPFEKLTRTEKSKSIMVTGTNCCNRVHFTVTEKSEPGLSKNELKLC